MAAEVHQYITEVLARLNLPEDDPQRRFLEGLQQAVGAFADQTAPAEQLAELQVAEPTTVASAQAEQPPKSENARIHLFGRTAARPDFRTLPKGRRRGHFPLATHPTPEETTYYDVIVWDKEGKPWATRLEEQQLQPGQSVEVLGYEHPVSGTAKDGRPKPSQIYAAAPIKVR